MTDVTTHPTLVTLSRVRVRDGFNPRGSRDPKRFAETKASIEANGVLQPVLVIPDPDTGDYVLVAGEGRWLASAELGMAEIPVHVREDVDADTGGFDLAMVENLARQDLTPLEEARGFQRLLDSGLTRKGVAQRLGIAQKRVTERLEILKLPEALQAQVSCGEVPPAAVKPLAKLDAIHHGLAESAVARVRSVPTQSWVAPITWSDLVEDPIGVLVAHSSGEGCELPAGAIDASDPISVDEVHLSDATNAELEELAELIGGDPAEFTIRFGRDAVEQAVAMSAAVTTADGYHHLIVGQDVIDQLAADYVHACLETQRDNAKRIANAAATTGSAGDGESDGGEMEPVSEEQAKKQRRVEREETQRIRDAAAAHNAELGIAVLKHLAKLKVDHQVLKVLTAVDVAGEIDAVALRGARYCFPSWPTQETTKAGKVKTTYLDRGPAAAKATSFVDGADSMAELAGRLFCLIAAARYADEDCVAQSNRSLTSLKVHKGVGYAGEVLDLIDDICADRLPAHLTRHVREQRAEARKTAEQLKARQAKATERLEKFLARTAPLTDKQREQATADVELLHGKYSLDGQRLLRELNEVGKPVESEEEVEAA